MTPQPPRATPALGALSRRQLLAGGAVLSLAWLTGCGDDEQAAAPAGSAATTAPAAGPWTFTDDRGTTIELDAPPQRLVIYPWTLLAGLWSFGARPVGAFGGLDGNLAISNVDTAGLASVGDAGVVNLEQLTALEPDLQIVELNPDGTVRFMEDTADQAERVAPLLAVELAELSVEEALTRIEELAAALGLDIAAPDVSAARTRFEDAAAAFRAMVAAAPDLSVMFCYASDTDGVLLYNPDMFPDLRFLASLGLNIVRPETDEWYDTLSWELAAPRATADVIMRLDFAVPPVEPSNPVWASLPAVAAGQSQAYGGDWEQYTYDHWATILTGLTEVFGQADPAVA